MTHDAESGGARDVCVVVLSWNGGAMLTACLESLRAQTHAAQVVVVDNASADGSPHRVRADFPEVVLLQNLRNLGVAEGYNVGLRYAVRSGARYVLVLNQDTTLEPAMIGECVRAAETDVSVGAVAPRLLFSANRAFVNSTGIEMNAAAWAVDRGIGDVDSPRVRQGGEVLAASGGAMFLRTEAICQVGFFDAAYFAYYEDVDLCLRLWNAGYRIICAPDAIVLHRFSSAFAAQPARKIALFRSNRWRLALKHFPLRSLLHNTRALARGEAQLALGAVYHEGLRGAATLLLTNARIAAAVLPALCYRLRHPVDPSQRDRWWRFVAPTTAIPSVVVSEPDFRLAVTEADARGDRIVMGVNDGVLGTGWHRLSTDAGANGRGHGLAHRRVGHAATCLLRVAAPGPYMLQLHVARHAESRVPTILKVCCNGSAQQALEVGTEPGEWCTLHVPLTVEHAVVEVQLAVETPAPIERADAQSDAGVLVSEVALLDHDSPLLRRPLGAPPPHAARVAAV